MAPTNPKNTRFNFPNLFINLAPQNPIFTILFSFKLLNTYCIFIRDLIFFFQKKKNKYKIYIYLLIIIYYYYHYQFESS